MKTKNQKVTVIGLGYIGLPSAAILAKNGFEVVGMDINKDVIRTLEKGEVHIIEPNLDVLIREVVGDNLLSLSSSLKESDVFLIAVPTPLKESKKPDLTYVESVAESLSDVIKSGDLIILESTVPVGTTKSIKDILEGKRPDLNFSNNNSIEEQVYIAHCPERVLPGNVLFELINNDRVIGGIDENSSEKASQFYKQFVKGDIYLTDSKTAELSKLVENSFRDVNIAFANELSLVSEELGIDVWELIRLANKHPRVNILQPGPGVGGHCIAIDPWFIVDSAPINSQLIKTAREVNDKKPKKILENIQSIAKSLGQNSALNITTLGLAFKKNIDDLRESPAMEIAKGVNRMGFNSHNIVEPNIKILPDALLEINTNLCDLEFGIKNADILLVLVDHDEFLDLKNIDLSNMKLIDTRGMLEIDKL